MGITNIIFIIIYYEYYGINYHSLSLQGKPQPPAKILSHPQHTYQHTYKLAYHNSITSFSTPNLFNYRNYHAQTTLHELVDDHVFLTSARCKQHSNPNFGAKWREKGLCGVPCWCQYFKVFGSVCLFIRHACTECQALKAHWHECSIETMPIYTQSFSMTKGSAQSTVWQVVLLEEQAFASTFTKIGRVMAASYRTPTSCSTLPTKPDNIYNTWDGARCRRYQPCMNIFLP